MNEEFDIWKAKPSPKNLAVLIRKYSRILGSELPKYQGNLPKSVIKSYGKKYMVDAIKTFDPRKSNLQTHIVSNLRKLHRLNYETSSIFRMSEELQRGANLFKAKKEELESRLHREPSTEELSTILSWSPSKVARMEKQITKETLSSSLEFSPAFVSSEDPIVDYIYHDLDNKDKNIFKFRTGYRGSPIMGVSAIAKKVNLSPASVSNRAARIARIIKQNMRVS